MIAGVHYPFDAEPKSRLVATGGSAAGDMTTKHTVSGTGGESVTNEQVDTNDLPSEERKFEPNFNPVDDDKFMHAEIVDGDGVIVDGPQRDRAVLIDSIKQVLEALSPGVKGVPKSARHRFLTDVCRIFKLATTIGQDDAITTQEVISDLENIGPDLPFASSDEHLLSRKSTPITIDTDPNNVKRETNSSEYNEKGEVAAGLEPSIIEEADD